MTTLRIHDKNFTLYISEEEIQAFAKMYGFNRIVCQCPVGQNSMRKRTKDLIASLEKEFPNARENLSYASLRYGSQKALNR